MNARSARRGRRPQCCVLGIDVGGTNIRVGLVSFPGGVLHFPRAALTRSLEGSRRALARVAELAGEVLDRARRAQMSACRVGIGVPELVDLRGTIASNQSLKWRSKDVRSVLRPHGRVTIASDVRAAALAEARLGAGRDEPTFLYLSVGTGLSSTLVIDGKPYAGASGHAIAFASGATCATQDTEKKLLFGSLEDQASGLGLVKRSRAVGLSATDARAVCKMAEHGPGPARAIVDSAARQLAVHVAVMADALDPGLIILGGGLGCSGGRYGSMFREALRRHAWAPLARRLRVRHAALGTEAGLIGAALAALEDN